MCAGKQPAEAGPRNRSGNAQHVDRSGHSLAGTPLQHLSSGEHSNAKALSTVPSAGTQDQAASTTYFIGGVKLIAFPFAAGSLVLQAAARLHSSIALLAQQQASDRVLRRLAAVRTLPELGAAPAGIATAHGAASAARGKQAGTDAAAAGAAAAGLPNGLGEGNGDQGDSTSEDENVDVAVDWEPELGWAGIAAPGNSTALLCHGIVALWH